MNDTKPESKAVTVRSLFTDGALQKQVARALPKHLSAERYMRIAFSAMSRVPALNQCEPMSIAKCLLDLSAFGLEPDGRRAHLIPYGNQCTLIVDWKGLVELAMRSGLVSSIHADVVCENDVFEYSMGEITKHTIEFRKPRGEVFAAYAVCHFKDGAKHTTVLGIDELKAIRARSKTPTKGPWVTDTNEMYKKCAVRRGSKFWPLSPEFRDAVTIDDEHGFNDVGDFVEAAASPVFGTITPDDLLAGTKE